MAPGTWLMLILDLPQLTKATQDRLSGDESDELNPESNPYGVPIAPAEFSRSCRIRTGSGFERFDLYPYQELLLQLIEQHSVTIIIKDRQLGITELLAAIAYYHALTDPAYSAAFVSINQSKAQEISSRIDGMAPASWGIKWRKNNGSELHPEKCGIMRFLPSTKNAARGFPSVNMLVFDEAGFLEYFKELYGNGTSAQESVPEGRRKIILNTTIPEEGTAHPVWGMFAGDGGGDAESALDQLKLARAGGTNCGIPGMVWWGDGQGCCRVVIGHKVHPVYGSDPDYIQGVVSRRKIPLAIANREHNLGIEAASASLFNEESIVAQSIGQWAGPVPGHQYFITIDPNLGGADNFATIVLDITDPWVASIVAEYAEANRSVEYSEKKTIELYLKYRALGMAIEANNGGTIVAENLLRVRPELKIFMTNTTGPSKKINTDRVAVTVEQGRLIYPADWEGVGEMRAFSAQTREATGGGKDDRVMSLAAGLGHLEEVRKIIPASVRTGGVRR